MDRTGATPRLVALWSAPRSRSTAFARMMAERGDLAVLHEPFSHVMDFGSTTVDGQTVHGEAELIAALRALSHRTSVFFKDTTDFHYPGLLADRAFLTEVTHTFIVRHPREAIASHYAVNPEVSSEEIGFFRLAEIFDAVAEQTRTRPVVIDSDDLIAHPAQTVRRYCELTGLPYQEAALSWQPGLRTEWEKTRRWHESTSRTSGFTQTSSDHEHTPDNHPLLAEYLARHLPAYEQLHAARMVVAP